MPCNKKIKCNVIEEVDPGQFSLMIRHQLGMFILNLTAPGSCQVTLLSKELLSMCTSGVFICIILT